MTPFDCITSALLTVEVPPFMSAMVSVLSETEGSTFRADTPRGCDWMRDRVVVKTESFGVRR
jgi:hypothetical protein